MDVSKFLPLKVVLLPYAQRLNTGAIKHCHFYLRRRSPSDHKTDSLAVFHKIGVSPVGWFHDARFGATMEPGNGCDGARGVADCRFLRVMPRSMSYLEVSGHCLFNFTSHGTAKLSSPISYLLEGLSID